MITTVGLGTTVNAVVVLSVQTPLLPNKVAVDGPLDVYGDARLMGETGPNGFGFVK